MSFPKRAVFLFLPVVLCGQRAHVDSLFVQANGFYERQHYAEAANMYDRILDHGFVHPNLYYNLGNAYYKLGWLGEAIWAYEKGLKLKPGDDDLRFNLKIANARIVDRVEAPEPFVLLKWYGALKRRFTLAQWLTVISVAFCATAAAFSLFRFGPGQLSPLLGKSVVLGAMATVILGLVFVDRYFDILQKREAIVVAREGRVYAAPTEISNLMFAVHDGTKVGIRSSQDPWLEIELIDGKQGWIQADKVRPL